MAANHSDNCDETAEDNPPPLVDRDFEDDSSVESCTENRHNNREPNSLITKNNNNNTTEVIIDTTHKEKVVTETIESNTEDDDSESDTTTVSRDSHQERPNPSGNHAPKLDEEESRSYGGNLKADKEDDCLRISTFNPRGIRRDQISNTIQHSRDREIDIQCFSEVNLDTTKSPIKSSLAYGLRQVDFHATADWSSSTITAKNSFKAGGTGIVTFGTSTNRIKYRGQDTLGRWNWMVMGAKGHRNILIVSIYQVAQTSMKKRRGNTAFHQQKTCLSALNRANTDPRRNFRNNLKKEIAKLRDKYKVTKFIIAGDWNEECSNTSTPQEICDSFGLVDIWKYKYPDHPEFKTYLRGRKRIDFMLISQNLVPAVNNVIYEPFWYRFGGDHRAMIVDFQASILFGDPLPPPYRSKGRAFGSRDCKSVATYLPLARDHLLNNNVFARLTTVLKSNTPDHPKAEALDRELTQACLHAENKIRSKPRYYWSNKICHAKLVVSIWLQYKYRYKRNLNSSWIISRAKDKNVTIDPALTRKEVEEKLVKARTELKELRRQDFELRQEMLANIANIHASKGNEKMAKAVRALRYAEIRVRSYRRYNKEIGKDNQAQSMSQIKVPNDWPPSDQYDPRTTQLSDPKEVKDVTEWREIQDPAEIEKMIMIRNRQHFGQAEGTPFTAPRLKERFNWAASTREAELVLEGNYTDPELTEIQNKFLLLCKRSIPQPQTNPSITVEQFTSKNHVYVHSMQT